MAADAITSAVPNDWNGTDPVIVSVPVFSEGNYDVVATLTDSAGNQSEPSNSVPFNFGDDAPSTPWLRQQYPSLKRVLMNKSLLMKRQTECRWKLAR